MFSNKSGCVQFHGLYLHTSWKEMNYKIFAKLKNHNSIVSDDRKNRGCINSRCHQMGAEQQHPRLQNHVSTMSSRNLQLGLRANNLGPLLLQLKMTSKTQKLRKKFFLILKVKRGKNT